MASVFVLQHLHRLALDTEDVKLIGVYRTRVAAISAVERLRLLPGFCDHPEIVEPHSADNQGFYIDEYNLDMDSWDEGYATV